MNFSRIFSIFIRQVFLIRTNPIRLSGMYIWLILDILQWGLISKYLGALGKSSFGFITVILGAVILWEFFTRIQQGIMTSFLEDVWSRNFINFFASPLKVSEYLVGMTMFSVTTGVVGFIIMLLITGLGFGYDIFKIGLLIVPYIIILFIFGVSIGILISSMVFRFGPSAEWFGWPVPFVISIFSGVYYPVSTLPNYFHPLAKLFPSSYVFESMRSIIVTGEFSGSLALNLLLGLLLSVVYLLGAYVVFSLVYRHNLKIGGIARFSAEQS